MPVLINPNYESVINEDEEFELPFLDYYSDVFGDKLAGEFEAEMSQNNIISSINLFRCSEQNLLFFPKL